MVGISGILIFSNLRNAQRPRKTKNYILTNLHTILKTHIDIKRCKIKFCLISAMSHSSTLSLAYAKSKTPKIRFNAPVCKYYSCKSKLD